MKKFTSALLFAFFIVFIVGWLIMHLSVTSYAAVVCHPYKSGNGCYTRIGRVTTAYLKDTSLTNNLSKNDVIKPYSQAPSNTQTTSTPIATSKPTMQTTPINDTYCSKKDVDCNQDRNNAPTSKDQHLQTTPIIQSHESSEQQTSNVTNNTYNTYNTTTVQSDNIDTGNFCTLPSNDDSVVVFCNGDVLVYYNQNWHLYRYNG